MKSCTARSPSKLILTGEYAVVFGKPALVVSLDCYSTATASFEEKEHLLIQLKDLNRSALIGCDQLGALRAELAQKHQDVLQGKIDLEALETDPFSIYTYALSQLLDTSFPRPQQGTQVQLRSSIPIGRGLGSSAATIMSMLFATGHLFQYPIGRETYLHLGTSSENLQHGHSSGVDPYITLHGGCVRFRQGKAESRFRLPASFPVGLVDTGRPQSTTGRCVQRVSDQFQSSDIWTEFEEIALRIEETLSDKPTESLIPLIRENHRLLTAIGVVPDRVQSFIKSVEESGGAAKICGAGAVEGDAAGIVMVFSNESLAERYEESGYAPFPAQPEDQGTHLVDAKEDLSSET